MAENEIQLVHDGEPESGDHTSRPSGIDQVREILFGRQMVDYDHRFQALQQKVAEESAAIRRELVDAVQSLEGALDRHMEDMSRQLREEREARSASDNGITAHLGQEADSLRSQLRESTDAASGDCQDLRDQISETARHFNESLTARFDELRRKLEEASGDLGHRKTDRALLANLLRETAGRLEQG